MQKDATAHLLVTHLRAVRNASICLLLKQVLVKLYLAVILLPLVI